MLPCFAIALFVVRKDKRVEMNQPKISVIIRTCSRPQVLRRALNSIREQVYKNIEVVVVEDGSNISEELLNKEFLDLNIVYRATGEKKGRCYVGNLGMQLATGTYFNFLDDDDIFLPNHLQVLQETIDREGVKAAYGWAEEHQIIITDKEKYAFAVKHKMFRYKQPFNRVLLCYHNYIPIQSILFSRELYDRYGGFDEQLEVLEDWDLWVRYAVHEKFVMVPIATSVYYTPYKASLKEGRQKQLDDGLAAVHKKHQELMLSCSVSEINKDVEYLLTAYTPPENGKRYYLKKIWNFLFHKDKK